MRVLIAGEQIAARRVDACNWRVLPPVETFSTNVSLPVCGSMENTVRLSCPRFEPYKNLPEGWTCTSAVLCSGFSVTPAGKVSMV